jgi:hypothetical protein
MSPLQAFEITLCRAVVQNYPAWKWSSLIGAWGRRARARIASFKADESLLSLAEIPRLKRIRMRFAYNSYLARFFYHTLIRNTATALFSDCYFDSIEQAQDYAAFVFSVRYYYRVLSSDLWSLWKLAREKGVHAKVGGLIDQGALRIIIAELEARCPRPRGA